MPTSQHSNIDHSKRPLRSGLGTMALIVGLIGICACSSAFIRQDDAETQESCKRNLKQYSLGMLMYCQDYDERFPPMKFPAQVEHRVIPYIKNERVFSCPATETHYLPNPAMNYLTLAQVNNPSTMMLLRDAKAHKTAENKLTWNATYVDGSVKLLTTEPPLGKLAPTPLPLTHAQQLRADLQRLRQQRQELDAQIRQLEKAQRRLRTKH